MRTALLAMFVVGAAAGTSYAGAVFTNGGFENGKLDGWDLWSQDYYANTYTSPGTGLTSWSPGGNGGTSSEVVTSGTDPIVGIGRTYGGGYAARIGDSTAWGYTGGGNEYNRISQTATVAAESGGGPGYLYFAWAAVLEISGHDYADTPFFEVEVLKNGTTSIYNYTRYEQDGGFWTTDPSYYWKYSTGNSSSYPGWYVESLDLAALGVNVGDTLTLTATARDCTPSAHAMYVYLDGFGGTAPTAVPLPRSAVMGLGLLGALGAFRLLRRR